MRIEDDSRGHAIPDGVPPGPDLLAFEQLLTAAEQAKLAEIRDWLDSRVRPHAADWWNAGRFPRQLIPDLAALDIVSPVRRLG